MELEFEIYPSRAHFDEKGQLIYHPLDGHYHAYSKEPRGAPDLFFAGTSIENLDRFKDIRTFIFRIKKEGDEREKWADPIRAQVFRRLLKENEAWYIGVDLKKNVSLQLFSNAEAAFDVESWVHGWPNRAERVKYVWEKHFFELPQQEMARNVELIWDNVLYDYTIEGYQMESGKISTLSKWNGMPKNDDTLRAIFDQTNFIFYSSIAQEYCHIDFLTAKYTFEEFLAIIDIDELKN